MRGLADTDFSFSALDFSVISTEVERSRAVRRDFLPAIGGLMSKTFCLYIMASRVYCEHTNDMGVAIDGEKQLKRWSRQNEEGLGGESNPNWEDLSVEKTHKSRLAARDPSTSVGMTEKTVGNTYKSE